MENIQDKILLSGIVGSKAYGLDTPESDEDVLGVFAHDTKEFFTVDKPWDTYSSHNPDVTYHEAEKYCRLALKCNPTLLDLLWLPKHLYKVTSDFGEELLAIRNAFLSKKYVYNSYVGYAHGQLQKISNLKLTPPQDQNQRARIAKDARHILRLLIQGYGLYLTGRLEVELENPEVCREFGEQVVNEGPEIAAVRLRDYQQGFYTDNSPLPDKPNKDAVNAWLLKVRRHFL